MSLKVRLNRLEKMGSGDRLWALIGIGKPKDAQHQRILETQARQRFYASGGDKEAYLAFLPFVHFLKASMAMSRKASLFKPLQTRPRHHGQTNGTPRRWNEHLRK